MDEVAFDPRVFEEFLRKQEAEQMQGIGFLFTRHEQLFPMHEQPFDTIDLTDGYDDLTTDY